jgi:hypothetical protein
VGDMAGTAGRSLTLMGHKVCKTGFIYLPGEMAAAGLLFLPRQEGSGFQSHVEMSPGGRMGWMSFLLHLLSSPLPQGPSGRFPIPLPKKQGCMLLCATPLMSQTQGAAGISEQCGDGVDSE